MADKVARVILGYTVDDASVNQAKQAIQSVKSSLQDYIAAIKSLPIDGGSVAVAKLTNDFAEFQPRIELVRSDIADLRQEIAAYAGDADTATSTTVAWIDELNDLRQSILASGQAAKDASSGLDNEGDIGNVSGLRRAGSALSAVGLTEAGRGVSIAGDIAQIGKLKGIISEIPPEVLATGVGVSALTVAFDLYRKAQEEVRQATLSEITARQQAIDLSITGTRDEIQARLNALQQQKEIAQANADDAKKLFDDLRAGLVEVKGTAALGLEDITAAFGIATGTFQAAHDKAAQTADEVGKVSTEMDILSQASGLTAQSTTDLAKAEAALSYERQKVTTDIARIEDTLSAQKEAQQQIDDGSVEGLQKRKDGILTELQSINAATFAAKALFDASVAGSEQQHKYKDEIDSLNNRFNALSATYDALSTSLVQNAVAANDAKKAQDEINQNLIQATKQYNNQIQQIETEKNTAILKAGDDLLGKISDIAAKTVEDEGKILSGLQDKEADLQKSLGRTLDADAAQRTQNRLQDQIKFQNNEVAEAKKTQQQIQQIQADQRNSEYSLEIDRNFAAIAEGRRNAAAQAASILQQSQQEKEARAERFQEQQTEDNANAEFSRQQKIKDEALQVRDAIDAANKQYALVETNRTKQFGLIQQQYNTEIQKINDAGTVKRNMLNSQITDELRQIAGGNDARLQLDAQLLAEEVKLIKGAYSDLTSQTPLAAASLSAFGGSPASPKILGAASQASFGVGTLGLASLGGSRAPDYSVLMGRPSSTPSLVTHTMNFSPIINANGLNAREAEALAVKVSNSVTAQAIRELTRTN